PVYDSVRDVSEASWKVERLMRDDILWREASQRVLAHFRDNHSIDAVIDRYEREIGALTRAQLDSRLRGNDGGRGNDGDR
ncbi:MAG: hypothetical protein ACXWAU_10035, partial [Usitatibacter sp.]